MFHIPELNSFLSAEVPPVQRLTADAGLPRISVVTVSFNQAEYLERAMLSVLNQNYPELEYIVMDGGSTDGSAEVIRRYSHRLKHWQSERDRGPAAALNEGFAHATGHWLAFLNSDDFLLPGALRALVASARRNADVLYGHGFFADAADRLYARVFSDPFSVRRYVYGVGNIFQQSALFTRAIFDRVGGFNEDNRTCWDGEFWVEAGRCGASFERVPVYASAFRLHPASISGSGLTQARFLADSGRIFRSVTGRDRNAADRVVSRALTAVRAVERAITRRQARSSVEWVTA